MTIPNAEDVGADLDDIVKEVIAEVFDSAALEKVFI